MNEIPKIHTFDDFRFDAQRFALYHKDKLVTDGDKKTMQVLAVLLNNPNNLTAHEEIIEKVWQDNPHGATSARIGQYIKRLRKIFAELAPEKEYIENLKGRGYLFIGDVFSDAPETADVETALPDNMPKGESVSDEKLVSRFSVRRFALVSAIAGLCFLIVLSAWAWSAKNDEEEIKREIKESQLYESLVLYKNPAAFREEMLDKYWLTEADVNINTDRNRIREAVQKLNTEGRRYGEETKCEQFEFQSIEINQNKDFAVVKTLEKWFIAIYFNDGSLQKNKTVGPYFVSYLLRKNGGEWRIEKSTTARVSRPKPRLTDIQPTSEIKSKQQFFVKITGQDFEPETVYLEVVGEGCPEIKPCKVPNSALRENSILTETALENVPLTLATGNFRITVRNGDSTHSNPVQLAVP